MKDVIALVLENRNEAYNLIKDRGGKINFFDLNISNNNLDERIYDYDFPWVIISYDEGLIDVAVLAVKCGDNDGDIEFFTFDFINDECYGWISCAECCSYSDNQVYIFIEDFKKAMQ